MLTCLLGGTKGCVYGYADLSLINWVEATCWLDVAKDRFKNLLIIKAKLDASLLDFSVVDVGNSLVRTIEAVNDINVVLVENLNDVVVF